MQEYLLYKMYTLVMNTDGKRVDYGSLLSMKSHVQQFTF